MEKEENKIMARSKKLLILSSVLLIAVVVYALALKFGGEKKENNIKFSNISAEDIVKIDWEYSDAKNELEKSGDKWIWKTDENYPINQTKVGEMLNALTGTKAGTVIEDGNQEEYGIDAEKTIISATLKDGSQIAFSVGNENSIVGQCYIMVSGNSNIYLVDTSFKTAFECSIDDLLQMENIPYISDAKEISITCGTENMTLTSAKNGSGTQWRCGETVLDTDKVDKIKTGLNSIAWTECVEYNADAQKLSEYGFDAPQAVLKWNGEKEEVEIEFGKNADDGTIYAKLKDSNMVYKVSSGVNEYFVTDYSTLLPEQTGDTAVDE